MKILTIRGSVAVGKSTFIKTLTKYLTQINKKFVVIDEPAMNENLKPILEKTIKGDNKNLNNSFQLLMLGIKLGQFKTTIDTYKAGESLDYIIMDRDFIEDKIFMNLYGDKNDEVYYDVHKKISNIYKNLREEEINIINIFINTNRTIQLQNYSKRTGQREEDIVDYIDSVNNAYNNVISDLINNDTILVDNDGTKNFLKLSEKVVNKIQS